MGYQESLIPITCLAEAEGIKDGIESYRRVHGGGLFYYCAARDKMGTQLYVCVGGDRYPYQSVRGPFQMQYLDDLLGWVNGLDYSELFEDLPETDVIADVPRHLPEMFQARAKMVAYLRSVDEEMRREDEREGRRLVARRPDYEGELGPSEHRCGAYSDLVESPLGYLIPVSDGTALCGIKLGDADPYFNFDDLLAPVPAGRSGWYPDGGTEPFPQLRDWLNAYFLDEKPDASELPIDPFGTEAKLAILDAIREIPYGELATFGEVAKVASAKRGKRVSAAVVRTVAEHNPIPIVIPSHRVVSASGDPTALQGSGATVVWLLGHEGVDLSRVRLPLDLEMPEHEDFRLYECGRHDLPRVLQLVRQTFAVDEVA
ncbi:MAG: methylated-DNA--[protein]-cysteine S-methyltransferase [Olegusella sp.]|nr:methylated-DNA--[protein]-cysteine S-methyltransferase [Olegusella sp.]